MGNLMHPNEMSNRDKFKALLKHVAVSAAMTAVPGTVQFIFEIGQKAYELWVTSPPEEREVYRTSVNELSEAELVAVTEELNRETGVHERAVVDVMVQSLQGMQGLSDDDALRSINAVLYREASGQTLSPQGTSSRHLHSSVSTLLGALNRSVETHDANGWPHIEGFEINGVLGRGVSGVVYLARDRLMGRVCALKVGDLVDERSFQDEVKAMTLVKHKHLIELWGSGKLTGENSHDTSRYWIAMPNTGGMTLADLWRRGELELLDRLRLLGEVLSGLAALHSAGLVHRDLKPANALVTPSLSVRLADFGLSRNSVRAGEGTMTAENGLEGTPAYMSPEQVRERRSGPEVDVWAFGVMLYEILYGERPFRGNNLMILGEQICTQVINFRGNEIPAELCSILMRCLARDKSQRYPSARELEVAYQSAYQALSDRLNGRLTHEVSGRSGRERVRSESRYISERSRGVFGSLLSNFFKRSSNSSDTHQEAYQDTSSSTNTEVPLSYSEVQNRAGEVTEVVLTSKPTSTLKLVYCPAGEFMMGSADEDSYEDERPQHRIKLTRSFVLGQTAITHNQWHAVMGSPHSRACMSGQVVVDPNTPVTEVTWLECIEFCNQLSIHQKLTPVYEVSQFEEDRCVHVNVMSDGYRLPTEAEWEYAAKTANRLNSELMYSGSDSIDEVAWYRHNAQGRIPKVAQKRPNAWGLYDLSGCVSEWCSDQWIEELYVSRANGISDPHEQSLRLGERLVRGGSYAQSAEYCRVTYRRQMDAMLSRNSVGFRVARFSS